MLDKLKNFHNRDLAWSAARLRTLPIYSAYWVHRRILSALRKKRGTVHGDLLDVGCGSKPYKPLFQDHVKRHFGIEYGAPEGYGYESNQADVFGDAAELPFASASFDTILCTEVLEHVIEPEKVVGEFFRVLRPGGTILCTAPFVYPVHDARDFYRYSAQGMEALLSRHGFYVDEVIPLSGTGLTLAIMLNLYWFEIGFMWNKWLYPFGLVLRPLLWLLTGLVNMLGWLLEKLLPSTHMSFNHLAVARKPA